MADPTRPDPTQPEPQKIDLTKVKIFWSGPITIRGTLKAKGIIYLLKVNFYLEM